MNAQLKRDNPRFGPCKLGAAARGVVCNAPWLAGTPERLSDGKGGGMNPVKKHALRGQVSGLGEAQNTHELRGDMVESSLSSVSSHGGQLRHRGAIIGRGKVTFVRKRANQWFLPVPMALELPHLSVAGTFLEIPNILSHQHCTQLAGTVYGPAVSLFGRKLAN
jgi:hypothetical protein